MRLRRVPRRRAAAGACLCFVAAVIVLADAGPLFAHDDLGAAPSPFQQAYQDFLFGILGVVSNTPVVLGVVAAGLFAGMWKPDGAPVLWLMYLGGLGVGAAVGFSGVMAPTLPAYLVCIAVGLLGAAALNLPAGVMRGIFFVVGAVVANALLNGFSAAEIPPFDYIGMAVALNLGLLAPAGLVALTYDKLPYGWVPIAWRAAMSWIVAIAVMALVLDMQSTLH